MIVIEMKSGEKYSVLSGSEVLLHTPCIRCFIMKGSETVERSSGVEEEEE